MDVAAASAHKWLLGPEGIGLLYVSDRVVERLRPARSGWRSMRDPFQWTDYDLTWGEGARRFESGTLNVYGIVALGGSLEVLLEVGAEEIEPRVLALAELAARGLAELRLLGGQLPPAGGDLGHRHRRPARPHRPGLVKRARRAGGSSSPPGPAACGSPPTSTTRRRRSTAAWRNWLG